MYSTNINSSLIRIENGERMTGRFWFLIYDKNPDIETLYKTLLDDTKGKKSICNPLILIGKNKEETHVLIDMTKIADWKGGDKFKYLSHIPIVHKILKWEYVIKKFKSTFKEIYPLSQTSEIKNTVPYKNCIKCNIIKTIDNFFIDSPICRECSYSDRFYKDESLDDLDPNHTIRKIINVMIQPLIDKNKSLQEEIEYLKNSSNRELLFKVKLLNFLDSKKLDIDLNPLYDSLSEDKTVIDGNIGCVVMDFGSAEKNCLPGYIFSVDFVEYPQENLREIYSNKTVIYISFTEDIDKEIKRYSKLKSLYEEEITFSYTKIPLLKDFLKFKRKCLTDFINATPLNFCPINIIGHNELKTENIYMVDKSLYLGIISILKN